MRKVAVLWDERYISEDEVLFEDEKLKKTMEYFCKQGERKGLKVYVSHFSSYDKGKLEQAYTFDGQWKEVKNIEIDLVFDKFYFNEETKELKYRIDEEVGIFNQPEFEEFCKDKFKVYCTFAGYVPKTVRANKNDLDKLLDELITENIVVKPRFGSGGESVKIVSKDKVSKALEGFDDEEIKEGNVLLQEFVDSSRGIPSLDVNGVHDLRIVLVDGKPSYSFVRTPERGKISNVSRGGNMETVSLENIPEKTMDVVKEIDKVMSDYDDRIYSIDFLFSESGEPFVVELNSKPGIKFNGEEVTKRKKKFIQDIIQALSS
ncbi:MAG: RimK family alpha-L-glutamate ligase [Candidatus Aenigmatarchaeota archaeon]